MRAPSSTSVRDALVRACEKVLTSTKPLCQPALVKRIVRVLERSR